MNSNSSIENALSWEELERLAPDEGDRIQGANNPYSLIRLFGQTEQKTKVTLYRDHHAWCPYCQKVWLWLEWKQIPYKVRKVTMRCYGDKEGWYLDKVPTGLLPALEIDKEIILESDRILLRLENTFGSLGRSLEHQESLELRFLERRLFQSWCKWLCYPYLIKRQEQERKAYFQKVALELEKKLKSTTEPWLDPVYNSAEYSSPGSTDIIFIPYLERMNASLAYYKGFNLREEYPQIASWFTALEKIDVYRGTQGDFHTHAHDLPPQMGGCWADRNPQQKRFSEAIDSGVGMGDIETSYTYPEGKIEEKPELLALTRVLKHRKKLLELNPLGSLKFDQPLRAALTLMATGMQCLPQEGTAKGLRYLRDRISVPRDMPLLSARSLRQSLEETAKLAGSEQSPPISTKDRFDQNPAPFLKKTL